MTNFFENVLKFISRSMGFFMINFGVVLILLGFFINSSINNIDVLKSDFEKSIQEQISNEFDQEILEEANLSLENNAPFNELIEKITQVKDYLDFLIFASFILFIIGFVFVYLGTFNILNTLYKISVHLTISNFLFVLYFKFFPNILNLMLNNEKFIQLSTEVPREYINKASQIILNWISTPLYLTSKLAIIFGSIFLIISIILYFVKKKALKVKNKAK